MKWLIVIFFAIAALIILTPKRMMQENKNNSAERMRQIRRIKKQKALARAESKKPEMRIAS